MKRTFDKTPDESRNTLHDPFPAPDSCPQFLFIIAQGEVSTAPVVFSLTALDSLLTPKYLDSFLRDLVDARGPENQVRLEKELEKSEACEKS
jgi:hypothetical protein